LPSVAGCTIAGSFGPANATCQFGDSSLPFQRAARSFAGSPCCTAPPAAWRSGNHRITTNHSQRDEVLADQGKAKDRQGGPKAIQAPGMGRLDTHPFRSPEEALQEVGCPAPPSQAARLHQRHAELAAGQDGHQLLAPPQALC